MIPVLLALAVVGILFIIVIAGRADEFKVARETRISAPPGKIFPHVNDLRAWEAWSPWAKLDPNARNSFEGPASGVGATMEWEGNCKIGVGRMTITESKPDELIRFRLEFFKPMQATNTAEFTFRADGNQTTVAWSMSGRNNSLSKVMSLFMDCEKMVGPHFEKGLATMKAIAEAPAKS